MSLQNTSKEKPLKNFVASFVEAYPDVPMHKIAVLFTDVVGSTKYFKTYGDIKGREMLRKHHRIAISIIEDYGGSLIKEVGDSVMVYFPDALNALKAAIKMQHQFSTYNNNAESQNKIHIRVGIHYGKVIVEEKDIYGDVVNVAAKLTNLADGDQIFISHEVYELTKEPSSAKFELVNFWNMKNVPAGLTIYRVDWENSPVLEPERVAILHIGIKDTGTIPQPDFRALWDNFMHTKDALLAGKHESEQTLPDGTLIVAYKSGPDALDAGQRILEYFSSEVNKSGAGEKPPVHMVITKDTHLKGNLLPIKKSKMDIRGFVPGDIYLSKSIYDDIKRQRDMSLSPPPIEHRGKAYYKYVKAKSTKTSSEQQTASINNSKPSVNNDTTRPSKNSLEPCFYCGSRNHYAKDCPSKNMTEITNALAEVGYLSPEKLNTLLAFYQGAQNSTLNVAEGFNSDTVNKQEIIHNCFYELKSLYQLRFFRTIWESKADFWEKAKKNISVSEGGFAWLALDSFRVSNHGRAETYIKTAQENNAKDYKPYCIMSFLNIERNNFTDALKDLDNALSLTRTNPQKMFIFFLQSRIYTLLGNIQKAQEKINKILSLDPGCTEAIYEDIILKFKQEKDKSAAQRLARLIIENRKYYAIAFIDPDLKPYDKVISEILTKLFNEAKTSALDCYQDAKLKAESIRITLTKKNMEDIQLSMDKIENMMATDSYFGYLDVSFLASSVVSICNNTLREQKKNLSEIINRLNKRLDQDIDALRDYHYPRLSANCLNRLKYLRSKIAGINDINTYSSADQFEASHRLCSEIAHEAHSQELIIKKLDLFQQMAIMSLSFLKHSSILFSIVFFVGIFLFPFLADPINVVLAKLDIASIPNSWSFQKIFLISGGLLSLIVSFLITAKKNI